MNEQIDRNEPKLARSLRGPIACLKPWPEDCGVQCGGEGLVLVDGGKSYTTAFFEAFPKEPKTFIRGEGATIADAEADAWAQFEKFSACPHPAFERRKYRNGAGFCVACGMFKSQCFEPSERCCICGVPTYHTEDNKGCWYCETHRKFIKNKDKTEAHRLLEKLRAALVPKQKLKTPSKKMRRM